jgi:hypothetical protein
LRTTNNIIFSSFESWRSTLQQAKDNSKQISNQNVSVANTFEQNTRDVAASAASSSSTASSS